MTPSEQSDIYRVRAWSQSVGLLSYKHTKLRDARQLARSLAKAKGISDVHIEVRQETPWEPVLEDEFPGRKGSRS